jgi:DNA-binding HxlR family transcriptional regulator
MSNKPLTTRCPIAHSADLFGDRWSLVIVRDMFMGKKRFGEFLASSEAITASVLTARLTQLEKAELIAKTPYQSNPVRFEYALTTKGRALLPVLQAISVWGSRNFPNVRRPPDRFMNMKSG